MKDKYDKDETQASLEFCISYQNLSEFLGTIKKFLAEEDHDQMNTLEKLPLNTAQGIDDGVERNSDTSQEAITEIYATNNVEYNYDNGMMNAMDESRDKGYKVIHSLVACEIYRMKWKKMFMLLFWLGNGIVGGIIQ